MDKQLLIIEHSLGSEELQVLIGEINILFRDVFKKPITSVNKYEQPEAITDAAHLCKHNVSGSAASKNTTTAQTVAGAASSETEVVSGNEQGVKVLTQCKCVWPQCNHFSNCRNR